MKGGFNKILRNIVAGSSDTEFEKRLTKATFHLDSKEPKEKHVIYLLESLNGEHKDQVSPIGALKFILERHISNLDNWAITTKVFIVLHRALQNKRVNRKIIRDLKKNEHLLHPYQKKNPDNKYNIRMFMEISKQYSVYIKYYMNTCMKTEIMTKPRKGFSEEVRNLSMSEILKNYEYFEGLSTQIFDLFQHTNFCKQTRLFSNVIFMLLKDLMEIYRIYYTHITEILDRFPSLSKSEAQKAFVMYQNFVNLTEAIKNKANKLIYIFNFPITLPDFYNPERGLIDTLRVVVSSASEQSNARSEEQSTKMNQVSSKLRAGMNREQFEEQKGEDLDAITDVYFDCNALDRIDQTANATSVVLVQDPSEELKMDKDLGLFEMINQGDFATVSGDMAAQEAMSVSAAAPGNPVDNQAFNFDAHASGNGQAAQQQPAPQSVDDFFGFSAQPSAPAQPAAVQNQNNTNDLLDVFSTNQPASGAAAADPLADIFAQGSQPLAPKSNEIPSNDKYSMLNSFYTQQDGQAAAQQQPVQNQFQTQNLPGENPLSQLMMDQANGGTNRNTFNGPQGGFQPMMQQQQQPQGFQPMMGMGQMGMPMNTNQPSMPGMNPFDAFGGMQMPQQDSRHTMPAGGFGTQPPQQQQQQQQNNTANAFNF